MIGAGFTALDCAHTALRLKAQHVQVCYRRSYQEAQARAGELAEGEKEGVIFNYLISPVEVLSDAQGCVIGLKLARNQLGCAQNPGPD